jgi:hypothetical protein
MLPRARLAANPGNSKEMTTDVRVERCVLWSEARALAADGGSRDEIFAAMVKRWPRDGETVLQILRELRAESEAPPSRMPSKGAHPEPRLQQFNSATVQQGQQAQQAHQASHESARGGTTPQARHAKQAHHDVQAKQATQAQHDNQESLPGGATETKLDHARQLLRDWQADLDSAEEWRLPFEIARVLRLTSETRPERLRQAILEFYDNDVYDEVICLWDKVTCPAGQDAFDLAARNADAKPLSLRRDFGSDRYRRLASFAWYASAFAGEMPIQLPRERLAAWLGCSHTVVSNLVQKLERDGIVECVDATYSHANGKAKDYRFTATEKQIGEPEPE